MKFIVLGLSIILATHAAAASSSFSKTKRIFKSEFKDVPGTLYCDCPVKWENNKPIPDLAACGYQVRKQQKRAERIEFEHIKSAWAIGHQRQCWQKGGRKECNKSDPLFKEMVANMHNIAFSVGEINGDRSNRRFGQWNENRGVTYGQCDMQIDFKGKKAMPTVVSRGRIARAQLYMQSRYDLKLSKSEQKLFETWDKIHPPLPDDWECKRNKRITKIQGDDNPYITKHCPF